MSAIIDHIFNPSYIPRSSRTILMTKTHELKKWTSDKLSRVAGSIQDFVYLGLRCNRQVQVRVRRQRTNSHLGSYLLQRKYFREAAPLFFVFMTTCKAHSTRKPHRPYRCFKTLQKWDTDSICIRLDNCASASISNSISDFVGPTIPAPGLSVGGISGENINNCMQGTIKWTIQDDTGAFHDILLPDSVYAPEASSKILSLQHWAQVARDHKPEPHGTWSATYDDRIKVF